MGKVYFTYDQIHDIVRKCSGQIKENFNPEMIIAIGGGGYIPGRMMRTFVDVPLVGIVVKLYCGEEITTLTKVQWFDDILINEIKGKRVLIVDEVDDTRTTLAYVVNEILKYDPAQVGIFVIHDKKKENKPAFPPNVNYYVGQEMGNEWIVYPWENE